MNSFIIQIAFFIFSVNSIQMYSSDPLCPNDFYLQQEFFIEDGESISENNFNPKCISVSDEPNIFRCHNAGTYTLSLENDSEVKFEILGKKKTYRWSLSLFERIGDSVSHDPTTFIERGKNYSLRIWITQLSFNSDIQNELNCISSSISPNSKKITLSFYSIGEFPIVLFTDFDEYNVGPVIFNSDGSYWEVEFSVENIFLRSIRIKGHDNSNIFDVVSETLFNFKYKSLIDDSSQLFSAASSSSLENGCILSINSIPCYPNYAIATVISNDSPSSKKFYFTNDGFNSIKEFGNNKNFLDVYLTIHGIYYINGKKIQKLENSKEIDVGVSFDNNDEPIGFFSSNQCDFYKSYGDQISYENRFIGVFSSKKIFFSYDGVNFKQNDIINQLGLTFLSVSYKWQSFTILALDLTTNRKIQKNININNNTLINDANLNKKIKDEDNKQIPIIVNYDLQNHMASRQNLPFMVNLGQVRYGSEYGFFIIGNNLLFSPDCREISSIFLPGHFQSNQDVYITSFVQKGKEFIATTSDNTAFCGNYKNSKSTQIFNNTNNGFLIIDSQENVVSVSINSDHTGFRVKPVMHYIQDTTMSFSAILNGQIIPHYLDSGDRAVTNLTIVTVSKYESSMLIVPPKNAILSHRLYSESIDCSTLVTYMNHQIDIHSNVKSSSEFCTAYYLSTRTLALSSYELQSRRGEGGEEGSNCLQILMYSNGKVFDAYNLPLIFGCSPKRRLGVRMHKKVCYPDENDGNCIFTVFYNKYFKPTPLIFDENELIGEASFDFALITSDPIKYKMNVKDAKCLRRPQSYEQKGGDWSRNNYENCFIDDGIGIKDVLDDPYTILNLTHNEVKINKRNIEYVEFKLINLGSSSTMCQLNYTFKVKVIERPINPYFIVLIIAIAIIIIANAMIFDYWQYIMFMYSEAVKKYNDSANNSNNKVDEDNENSTDEDIENSTDEDIENRTDEDIENRTDEDIKNSTDKDIENSTDEDSSYAPSN